MLSIRCPFRPARRSLNVVGLALIGVLVVNACSRQTVEERARETAEKIQKSMVDVEGIALDQQVEPAIVSEVQKNLTTINEYQGEIDCKLDTVTVNAIQSFQRAAGLKDDGNITQATRQKLAAAAGQARS